jgi:hypothetical protein
MTGLASLRRRLITQLTLLRGIFFLLVPLVDAPSLSILRRNVYEETCAIGSTCGAAVAWRI